MRAYIFVSFQDDDIISRFDIGGGIPENRVDYKVPGGPAALAINPQKTRMFAGTRKSNELVCLRIGQGAGISIAAKTSLPNDPCFVTTDRDGRYIFTTYYRAGQIAVHRRDGESDAMIETQRITTEPNAHSVWLVPGDRYVFVPHTGPNKIYVYEFDRNTGTLNAAATPWIIPERKLEPRHLCFHPILNCFYSVNEGSSTLSVYDYDRKDGSAKCRETVSTLPAAAAGRSLTAEIRLSPDGRFLYASNRGNDSIACFAVDSGTGSVKLTACVPAPVVPRSFDISPDGCFLYAAGQDSGELAVYKIDPASGGLAELSRTFAGNRPMWVMAVTL